MAVSLATGSVAPGVARRPRRAPRSEAQGYDSGRVIAGFLLGTLLGLACWIGLALLARTALG